MHLVSIYMCYTKTVYHQPINCSTLCLPIHACKTQKGQLNVPADTTFKQVSASPGNFACGVTSENDIKCWGDNHRKQCEPPSGAKYTLVSTSRLGACAIKV